MPNNSFGEYQIVHECIADALLMSKILVDTANEIADSDDMLLDAKRFGIFLRKLFAYVVIKLST